MSYLCLDLSLKSTGYAVFTSDGKLKEKNKLCPTRGLPNPFKAHYLTDKIKLIFRDHNIEDIIIEDLYYSPYNQNVQMLWDLARLSGAVVNAWLEYKYREPIFYKACHARKLVGINGRAHKAEVQLWILNHYHVAFPKQLDFMNAMIDLEKQKKDKQITKGQFDYRAKKISKEIEEQTGYGEDICDALVLGLAYAEERNKNG